MALALRGYRELLLAIGATERQFGRELRGVLREVGEGVRADAATKLRGKDAKSASGFRVRVRQRGVDVEQSLRATTPGDRHRWGEYQMRNALLPAVEDNEGDVDRRMEEALDNIADYFETVYRFRAAGLLN